ncbi:MAG: single-stranded DNA-binding protein [Patescibacteria group bacterium]|nr:single-stranded DNA-binding protein [Patescibacteria group bacterium]
MNFNKAIIVGRLTREPESRAMPSGKSVVSFGIATNNYWTDASGNKQETVEYHNIVAFGKLADTCSQYLTKGQLALVEGRIQTSSWNDQSGSKRYKTEIIINNMQMGPRPGGAQPAQSKPSEPAKQSPAQQSNVSQEDIPVIEAEKPITEKEEPSNAGANETENASDDAQDEVNVKNIPF